MPSRTYGLIRWAPVEQELRRTGGGRKLDASASRTDVLIVGLHLRPRTLQSSAIRALCCRDEHVSRVLPCGRTAPARRQHL